MTDARYAALVDAVRVRPNKRDIGLPAHTLEMLEDIAGNDRTAETRIEAAALRDLIDMNARIGIALAQGDANPTTTMRGTE